MKKVITITLFDRPEYTKIVLDALGKCNGIGEYLILPHIEPGNEEVLELVKAINFAECQPTINQERLGTGRNTFLALEHGFQEGDFVIHVQDDTVPSCDCLQYMEYCNQQYVNDGEIFSVASYNREACSPSSYYEIGRRRAFTCWLVGFWKNRWPVVKSRWCSIPSQYASHLNKQLNDLRLKEIYPFLSRCQNIGAEKGVHVPSAEWHKKHQHTEHWAGNFNLSPGQFFESNVRSEWTSRRGKRTGKVITMVLYNRPEYTKTVLDALSNCDGIGEYLILPHIEPGDEEVFALAKKIDFAETQITLNPERLGIGRNTYLAWEHGFREGDFIIHIEDDTVPARDCLRYMEYCNQAYKDDKEIFSIASYNRSPCLPSRYYQIVRHRAYTCWLVGLWKDRWEWVKDKWNPNPERYATHLNNQLALHNLKEIYPLLSRCQNIGAECGVHVPSVEWHRKHQHTEHWAGNYDLEPGYYWESKPLVTAVMVTGMHKNRYALAKVAIDCFKRQTYPNKELLIINHGDESLYCGDDRIRELRFSKKDVETVGDLRNFGLKYANGDFIVNWDDDDWYHPKRIEVQMDAQVDESAVFLANRIHYSFENKCARYMNVPGGAHATILHPKRINFRYPSLARKSDSVFAKCFKKRITIDNDASLYIRFYHGMNLWDAKHIMRDLADSDIRDILQVSPEHQTLLAEVLSLYNGWMPLSTSVNTKELVADQT